MPIIKKTGFMVHPEGLHRARLIEIVEVDSLRAEWSDQFMCTFRTKVTDQNGEHVPVFYYVSQKLNALSNFGQMVKALGVNIEELANGQELDTDDLLNRTCSIVVEHQDRGDGSVRAKVVSVLPDSATSSTPPSVESNDGDSGEASVPF